MALITDQYLEDFHQVAQLDAVARAVAADRVLWHGRRGQRVVRTDDPLRHLLLAVLPQQPHQPLR